MKSFHLSLLSLCFANMVYASEYTVEENYRFVGDEKAMEICAAALRADISIATEAKRLHVTRKALRNVTCNGQSLAVFPTQINLLWVQKRSQVLSNR